MHAAAHTQTTIKNLLPTVHRIARRANRRNSTYDVGDLVQIGSLGLVEAVRKHSDDQSADGFAVHRIRGAILDFLRAQDPLTRNQRGEVKRLDASRRRLGNKLARAPRVSEVAADAGVSLEEYARIALQGATSLCAVEDERLESECPTPSALIEKREQRARLSRAVTNLEGRSKELVVGHYIEGESLSEIGQRFGVSPTRMSQLHAKAMEQLRAHMQEPSVD